MDMITAYKSLFVVPPGQTEEQTEKAARAIYSGYYENPLDWARAVVKRKNAPDQLPPALDDLIDWHTVLYYISYRHAHHGGHYFRLENVQQTAPDLLTYSAERMEQRAAPHTTAGTAFYTADGKEWQAMELYNRDTGAAVYLPWTDETEREPNISQTRHEGRRTIDDRTYKKWCKYYNI